MRPLLCWALVLLAVGRPALADERPDAENMGKLLAYTVNCGCVVGEKAWILETYEAAFADAYGQGYASALQAPLQGALMDGWDRNMSLCKRICDQPITRQLQLSLAQADGGTVDGSAIRAILGPAPANEPAASAAAGGETGGSAQGAVAVAAPAPGQAEEEVRSTFAPQPNYCVYRNYARGCTPAEGEVPVTVVVEPAAADALEPAGATGADPGQDESVPPAPAETQVVVETEAVVATSVEPAYQPSAAEAETSSGGGIDALYATAGSGDNWSTAICRASPSRPDCRKPGAE